MVARILIIDDDPQVRTMLRDMLEENGYEVVDAANGKEGIERYREVAIDLVITDIIMPEQEGIETIIALQKDDPKVRIIAISGGGRMNGAEYLVTATAFGLSHVFHKPVEYDALLGAVAALLNQGA